MTILLVAVIATYSVGMYFLYNHWRKTPLDAFFDENGEPIFRARQLASGQSRS